MPKLSDDVACEDCGSVQKWGKMYDMKCMPCHKKMREAELNPDPVMVAWREEQREGGR